MNRPVERRFPFPDAVVPYACLSDIRPSFRRDA